MANIAEDIRDRLDIVDVVGRYVSLSRAGANYKGLCPFHNEKTPSFVVSPQKQICKCFGCGGGGDIISFIEQVENIDFLDAIKILGREAGVDMSKYERVKFNSKKDGEKEKIKKMNSLICSYFSQELKKEETALSYVQGKRKLDDAIISKFQLGYAPDSYYGVLQFLKSKGFSGEDMKIASLAKAGHGGEDYAFFRGRLMIPIRDHMGNVIGFGGRAMKEDQKPKYINTADTAVYDKSKVLYGINFLKQGVREHDFVVVVEGYMDVIAMARLGYDNAVASCGTSLTAGHMKLMKRYTEHVYFLFDTDKAGFAATKRSLQLAYKVDSYPKVLLLPEGKDLDDYANSLENAEGIVEELLETSIDGLVFVMRQSKKQSDMTSPIDKKKVLDDMFMMIAHMNNVTLQQHYLEVMAQEFHITIEVLLTQFKQFVKKQGRVIKRDDKKEVSDERFRPGSGWLLGALVWGDFLNGVSHIDGDQLFGFLATLVEVIDDEEVLKRVWTEKLSEEEKTQLGELQLWWEQELEKVKEGEGYAFVMRTIQGDLQRMVQIALKKKSLTHEQKKEILEGRRGVMR